MGKKHKRYILGITGILILSSLSVSLVFIVKNIKSNLETKSNIQYNDLVDGTLEAKVSNVNCDELSLPSFVNGKKVTQIGESGFKNCSIKSIILPETITTIKDNAFDNCKSINKIKKRNKKESKIKIKDRDIDSEELFFLLSIMSVIAMMYLLIFQRILLIILLFLPLGQLLLQIKKQQQNLILR